MAILSANPSTASVTVSSKSTDTKSGGLLSAIVKTQDSPPTISEKNTGGLLSVFATAQEPTPPPTTEKSTTKSLSNASPYVPSKSNTSNNVDGSEENIVLLSRDALEELQLQEKSMPNRWLDFFCIVGLDPKAPLIEDQEGCVPMNKPILLDRYPKEDHSDMEFPEHLPTFCFPNGGCRPLRYKLRRHESMSSNKKLSDISAGKRNTKKKTKTGPKPVKYHHNVPDPMLCNIVLTSGSGHRLYCTALTVYEIRKDTQPVEEKPEKEPEPEEPPPVPEFNKNWWEEPDVETMSKNIEKKREKADATPKPPKDVYYWMVPKCLVLMSHYPFFQAQSIALKELFYTVQSGVSPIPFERYIAHLIEDVSLPRCGVIEQQRRGQSYTVVEWTTWTKKSMRRSSTKIPPTIRLERPPPNQLPLLNVSMEPLFRTLSLSNILVIWANLLQEGKVVLACSSSETIALLAPISEALLSLLFPLEWQGIYVPVLPNHDSVLDMLEAPVPYLIGLVNKQSDQQSFNPNSHPSGVLWCDLDSDTLHLGFKGDQIFFNDNQEETPLLPALPSEASMALKAELEEIADPLYLPTIEGIKGRITVGDRTTELHNAHRQPYAQRTKVFDQPRATPRKYILTQCSKIPPRGKALKYEDYSMVPNKIIKMKTKENLTAKDDVQTEIFGLTLEDIEIPCGEDLVSKDVIPIPHEDNKKEEEIAKQENATADEELKREQAPKPAASNQDAGFLLSLKQKKRSMQAHVDRAMAVIGKENATPSAYAISNLQIGEDILSRQDEIAANFFSVNEQDTRDITERVRESFLRFFLVTFARYKFYFDPYTKRFDQDRFVASLSHSYRQKEYLKEVVTSQMFEIFIEDPRSIKNRKLFDEFIVKNKFGKFSIGENKKSNRSFGTPLLDSSQWRNPTVVVPEQPCRIGLREGLTYCDDRRFPDKLNPDECITNRSISFWRLFMEGMCCG